MQGDAAALGEPLYLCGAFEVARTDPPRIHPARGLSLPEPEDWTRLGFPHYSGLMTYAARFEWSGGSARLWLEAGGDQHDPFEVRVNGTSVGVCCWHPWRVELTPALRVGMNEVEILVANTLINRIEGKAQASGLLGRPQLRRAEA
jgi:hypothetical protein